MKETPIYQTLEDRQNDQEIEEHGPFFCALYDDHGRIKKGTKEPWLGEGYYFWDSRIEDAKWWGDNIYRDNGYVVYRTSYDQHSEYLFDTVGDLLSLDFLLEIANILKSRLKSERITLLRVIDFLKDNTDFASRYKAIRVWPQAKSRKISNPDIIFQDDFFCLNKLEKVQICFFDKTLLVKPFVKVYKSPSLNNFTV